MAAVIRYFKTAFGSVSSDLVIPEDSLVDESTFELLIDEDSNDILIEE